MTPLEFGWLLSGLFFLLGTLWLRTLYIQDLQNPTTPTKEVLSRGLWLGALFLGGSGTFLTFNGGNFFLLDWLSFREGNPHGSSIILGTQNTYQTGSLQWGFIQGDLKFLAFGVWFLALGMYLTTNKKYPLEALLVGLLGLASGLITMVSDHVVVLYLGLELQALCVYTLAGLSRFQEEQTESALRYLLAGSFVSGFLLWGFLSTSQGGGYGQSGSLHVVEFVQTLQTNFHGVGSAWVLGALLFKVGVFPFHFWGPSVYAPLEWGTLGLLIGSFKVNVWFLFLGPLRNLVGYQKVSHSDSVFQTFSSYGVSPLWWTIFGVGFISVVVGAVGGFFQTSLGGLLGYSGVINGGYLLILGVVSTLGESSSVGSQFYFGYYLSLYLFGTLFFLVGLSRAGQSIVGGSGVNNFTGWAPQVGQPSGKLFPMLLNYYLALNLAGLPVFPGFFSKLALLLGVQPFGWTLSCILIVFSVVPAVYYVSTLEGILLQEENLTFKKKDESTQINLSTEWRVSSTEVVPLVVVLNGALSFVVILLLSI